MTRLTGLWVYQTLDSGQPDPDAVVAAAKGHGLQWLSAEAVSGQHVLDQNWLKGMRAATKARGLRLGVHGYIGRPQPEPAAEAEAMATAIEIADADFAIVDAEKEYEFAAGPVSKQFVDAYVRLNPGQSTPGFTSYFSSFGRPEFHSGLNFAAFAKGGFHGMPQAYENLNSGKLKPAQCVAAWAQFFAREKIRPTLGCFDENGHGHLPVERLVESVREIPGLRFNVYRHGTVTDSEFKALAAIG